MSSPLRRSSLFVAAALVALSSLAPIGSVLAEPGAYSSRAYRNTSAEAEASAQVVRRQAMESVLGREVRTSVEEDVGRIIDLLADRDGRVQAAVIEFGGFLGIGTRKIAVDWSVLRFESDGRKTMVIVDLTRDQLRVAPEYKSGEPAIVRRASE
jgi:PRC-barrel domain